MTTKRPQVPQRLIEEVESLHEAHRGYEASNFQEALATVTELARRGIEFGTDEGDLDLSFTYAVDPGPNWVTVTLSPQGETRELLRDRVSAPSLAAAFEDVAGVEAGHLGPSSEIELRLAKDPDREIDAVVEAVFEAVEAAIRAETEPISELEAALERRGVRRRDE